MLRYREDGERVSQFLYRREVSANGEGVTHAGKYKCLLLANREREANFH